MSTTPPPGPPVPPPPGPPGPPPPPPGNGGYQQGPPVPPPGQYQPGPQPMSPQDEKLWATLVHIGGILFSWVAPLIVYLVLKDRGPFIREHAKAALNFQLTLLIAYIVGYITLFFFVGGIILLAASVVSIIFGILAALAANKGQYYKYPMTINFIK